MSTLKTPDIVLLTNHDPSKFRDESFEMDDTYQLRDDIVLITLGQSAVLTIGNIMTIVMRPGVGKSNVCEAVGAGGINPEVDSLGFKVDLHDRSILFIDTERTINDLGKGYKRIKRRARVYNDPSMIIDGKLVKLKAFSYKVLDSAEKYIKHLEGHLKNGDYSLVILDQAADFLKSINNEAEAQQFVRKLEQLGAKHECGFLITIHPNPMDKTYKPNGWIGSYLLKRSETVMAGFKAENQIRVLTTEFEHGKVRGAYDIVETAFKWSDDDSMFMSIEVTGKIKESVKKYEFIDKEIGELFEIKSNWAPEDLVIALKQKVGTNHKKLIDDNFLKAYSGDMGVIQMFGGFYFLRKDEGDKSDDLPF